MRTTTCFETRNKNWYLYDNQKQNVLTIHPVLSFIHEQEGLLEFNRPDFYKLIIDKFPDLKSCDIDYYIKKHQFLAENNFFEEYSLKDSLSARITPAIVENQMANIDHVLFQVTADCNLQCRYCCYGELYENPSYSQTGSLSFEKAKKVLDYLVPYWESKTNTSYKNKIIIGFYGGEPLVNFQLIYEIVEYVKQLNIKNNATFMFNMTTNALLLDKYMDFLVENDFSILFSLDGDEMHDYLRVDKHSKPTFKRVFANIKKMQEKYPEYFEKSIQFNSLVNDLSTPEDIFNFIYKEFGKIPMIGELSKTGLKPDKVSEFEQIYKSYEETNELTTKMSSRSSNNKNIGFFFYYHLKNSYRQYYELMMSSKKLAKKIPTGTCLPFWKKIFISSTGNIYACERIGFDYVLGNVDTDVNINFTMISNLYNRYYDAIVHQCSECYLGDCCSECMFQFETKESLPVCNKQQHISLFNLYLSSLMTCLENNPECFDDVNNMVFA